MTAILEQQIALPGGNFAADALISDPFKKNETGDIMDDGGGNHKGSNLTPVDQALFQMLCELAVRLPTLAGIHGFCVWLYQPTNYSASWQLLMASPTAKHQNYLDFPFDHAVADWVWEHRCSLNISNENECEVPDLARRLLSHEVKSFCVVPLMIGDRRIGIIGLASNEPEGFQRFDFNFIPSGMANTTKGVGGSKDPNAVGCPTKANTSSAAEVRYLQTKLTTNDNFEGIIGRSAAITELRKEIKVVAPTGSTVLILGETGTGKERIAQAIHNLSSRRERPFIKVNCAAIPAGLIESELFGHERGSFTGAVGRRVGRFEMAHGGTLFLDEIGDIPLELQPKLLRVLQEQEFERLGGTQTTRVDVRVVAATSRDLPRMVASNEFRGDLYYRLNVFPLRVPPLRERSEDIALLVRHFVDFYAQRMSKPVKDVPLHAMDILLRYPWPGNVRELQNVIERAVILSSGNVLHPPLVEIKQAVLKLDANQQQTGGELTTFKDAAREHIIQALAATNWVLGGPRGASARLGLARTTLIGKMQKLGISRAQA